MIKLQAFAVADVNKDDALDRAEYDAFIQRMSDWQDEMFGGHNDFTPEQVQMIFDQVSQGSGSITKEAFVHEGKLEGYVFGLMVADGTFKSQ